MFADLASCEEQASQNNSTEGKSHSARSQNETTCMIAMPPKLCGRKRTAESCFSRGYDGAVAPAIFAAPLAPGGPDLITWLPSDILGIIIGAVPLQPRMLVLSVLSRRWSVLCRASVTHLPSMSIAATEAALRVLPNVNSIASFSTGLSCFPSSLTSVSFGDKIESWDDACKLTSLTALTSLDLGAQSRDFCVLAMSFVPAAKLTHLYLPRATLLAGRPQLLALRSLTVSTTKEKDFTALQCYASQLTSLKIKHHVKLLQLEMWTNLRSLAVQGMLNWATDIPYALPNLTDLAVVCQNETFGEPFPLYLLQAYNLSLGCSLFPAMPFARELSKLTKLHSLSLFNIPASSFSVLSALPTLTSLHTCVPDNPSIPLQLQLPRLVDLTLKFVDSTRSSYFSLLRGVLRSSPCLRRLKISFAGEIRDMHERKLESVIKKAAASGVEELTVFVPSRIGLETKLLRLAEQNLWLRLCVRAHPKIWEGLTWASRKR